MTTTQPDTAIDLDVPPAPPANPPPATRDRRYMVTTFGLGLVILIVVGLWIGEVANRPDPQPPAPPMLVVVDVEEDTGGGAECFIQVGDHTVTGHVTDRKVCEWLLPADDSLPPRLVVSP